MFTWINVLVLTKIRHFTLATAKMTKTAKRKLEVGVTNVCSAGSFPVL